MQVEYENGGGKRSDIATTLGAGGMFIATEDPLDVHTRVVVRFQIPGCAGYHTLEARVVWADRPSDPAGRSGGMGIEFIDARAYGALALELERLES